MMLMEVRRGHGECGMARSEGDRYGEKEDQGWKGKEEDGVWCEVVVGRRCRGPRGALGRGKRRRALVRLLRKGDGPWAVVVVFAFVAVFLAMLIAYCLQAAL